MKSQVIGLAALAASLSLALACITVNIYFPEAAVKQAASEIVEEVRQHNKKDESRSEPVKKQAVSRNEGFSIVPAAFAQQETSVSTPTIRALKDSMKRRFPDLKPYYDGGNVGENNAGFVEIRDDSALSLKDKAALRDLVRDENNDRTKLYAEVARALDIDPSQVGRVQKIFAESWINNAAPGWWVQKDDGAWGRK
ncbi:MAG: hypothetical protein A2W03_09635 [Candidatus Aminicenantes bacterium RBG_16_63_16]|nr:MAG: hypothetical protein A2W03_09635 [Candidatus Aminicenantes bacterium RBG_16_63_16]